MSRLEPQGLNSISLKKKRSEFISNIKYINSAKDFKFWIKENKKNIMLHLTYAGEPSGSAGRPILTVLKKNNIVNAAIITVRYFGGIKLGKRGLIDAYTDSATLVMDSCKMGKWEKFIRYRITAPIENYGEFSKSLKALDAEIISDLSAEELLWEVRISRIYVNQLILFIKNVTKGQGELVELL
jgi:putative IMPACT (imprinted ancient) family translation regulator